MGFSIFKTLEISRYNSSSAQNLDSSSPWAALLMTMASFGGTTARNNEGGRRMNGSGSFFGGSRVKSGLGVSLWWCFAILVMGLANFVFLTGLHSLRRGQNGAIHTKIITKCAHASSELSHCRLLGVLCLPLVVKNSITVRQFWGFNFRRTKFRPLFYLQLHRMGKYYRHHPTKTPTGWDTIVGPNWSSLLWLNMAADLLNKHRTGYISLYDI